METKGRRTAVTRCGRAAMWMTLLWTCSLTAAETNEWRSCRSAGHRRYEEDVLRNSGGGGGSDGRNYDPGYFESPDSIDENNDDDGETVTDDDHTDNDKGYFRLPVDDKPKRGAGKPFEKKQDASRSAAPVSFAADAASGNGLRVDTTLLRGETIELPTYVNVPVTLRCRFEPVDGTEDKFDTVVEAMYPGHRDAPPPPPGSHAFRILKQLMGSVDGWRGVAHNSVRSVRRASGNWFGRREWPTGDDEIGDGSRTAEHDQQVVRDVLARQRAAERMRRFHDSRQDIGWPERFHSQSAVLLRRFDGRPVASRKWSENQLVVDQEAEQDVYGQRLGGRQPERVYDLQAEPQIDDSQRVESADYSQRVENADDSQQVEDFDELQQVEGVEEQLQVEPVEDRAAAGDVDDRRAQGRSLPAVGQNLQHYMTATSVPEIATSITSDFEKFRKDIPIGTYMEHAYTTDLTL